MKFCEIFYCSSRGVIDEVMLTSNISTFYAVNIVTANNTDDSFINYLLIYYYEDPIIIKYLSKYREKINDAKLLHTFWNFQSKFK